MAPPCLNIGSEWSILAIINLQVTPILPIKFWVNWPFFQEKFKIDFQDSNWQPSWILDQNSLSYFSIYMSPWYVLPSFESIGISVQEKFKTDLQDGSHLGFPIGKILATFDLQVTLIPPTKFESVAFSLQEEKFKLDFQDGSCDLWHLIWVYTVCKGLSLPILRVIMIIVFSTVSQLQWSKGCNINWVMLRLDVV